MTPGSSEPWVQRSKTTLTQLWNSQQLFFYTLEDGRRLPRIRYGDDDEGVDAVAPCRECYTRPGGFHAPGCFFEQCPGCKGTAEFCDCGLEEVNTFYQRFPYDLSDDIRAMHNAGGNPSKT